MALVPMQKIAVVAHKPKEEQLLELLQKEGVLEISDIPESVKVDHTEFNYRAAELDFAIQRLLAFADKETQGALRKKATEEQIVSAALHTDIRGAIGRVHALEASDQEIRKNLAAGAGTSPGGGSDVQPAYFASSSLRDEVEKIGGGTAASGATEGEMKEREDRAKELLKKNDADRTALSKELPQLVLARQYLRWLHDKQAVREAMQRTRSTVILLGWLAKEKWHALEQKLHRALPESALLKMKTDEHDEAPVLLRNPKMLQPFESVTTLYGLPQSSEIDPTTLLSLFFILFFGLCLTDAGYGLSLALIMGAWIWKKKLTIEEGRLWWLLMIGGIVTFFVSIPFGGWFGLTPDKVPSIFTVDTNGDGVAD